MKKILCVLISVFQIASGIHFVVSAEESTGTNFWEQVTAMVEQYEEDSQFSTMSVTIGESEIDIDGESIPIDESGSVPYVENGRTMMPVRGLAEAIGAEVSYDDANQKVTVETEETIVAMTIGRDEMDVNGKKLTLLNAPQIVNDRTMLPVRDVAEALDCEVEWVPETETAVFTRPLQSKRIIAQSENIEHDDAIMSVSGEGMTVLQFDSVSDTKDALEKFEQDGVIAEADYLRKSYAMSWGAEDIGSEKYHNDTSYAAGSAIVAVVDTGVDLSHEFFKGRLVSGYDVYYNDNNPQDTEGHGTHVASTVLDVAGVNTSIKIMPVKVFPDNDSYTYGSTIAAGIEYAARKNVDVINLSVGGAHLSQIEQKAINIAHSKNIAVVAAAGNESLNLDNSPYAPAALEHVITVSAMDTDGKLASFSNYGASKLEFTAPGIGVKGAKLGGGYASLSGTSMASPHVAGVYALIKAVHPDLDVDDITEALSKNAIDKDNRALFGYGFIRANRAERCISSVWTENVKISDVTDTTALISGTVHYEGIIPEYVGVRMGETREKQEDIHKIRFVDEGNGFMDYSYKLNSLKPNTTYYACIFMNPTGDDYVSKDIKFTTGNSNAPTPDPIKSELRILPEDYPIGKIDKGKSYGLSGRIKSNCHITDVRSYILDDNKNIVQESSGWTTTATYVIEKSALDRGLKFGELEEGTYYVKYAAEDETGNTVTWTSEEFKVVSDNKSKSELRILPDKYPEGTITKGKKFYLSGRIKSDYHITDVRAYLLDEDKNVIMEASGWTTTKTYVIENSALDRGMKFGELPKGKYYLKYSASDESGNTVNWASEMFYVE